MRGSDGAIFVYDCTEKRSKNDFAEHNDWYQRACGFDKPWLIISNKNDQKKKSVQDEEGKALAKAGPNRDYVAISLGKFNLHSIIFKYNNITHTSTIF